MSRSKIHRDLQILGRVHHFGFPAFANEGLNRRVLIVSSILYTILAGNPKILSLFKAIIIVPFLYPNRASA